MNRAGSSAAKKFPPKLTAMLLFNHQISFFLSEIRYTFPGNFEKNIFVTPFQSWHCKKYLLNLRDKSACQSDTTLNPGESPFLFTD